MTGQLQPFPHFFSPRLRGGDFLESNIHGHFAGLNPLQQAAFKRAATLRSFIVDPAEFTIKAGTRLREGELAPPLLMHRQPKFFKLLRVVALIQFDVCK